MKLCMPFKYYETRGEPSFSSILSKMIAKLLKSYFGVLGSGWNYGQEQDHRHPDQATSTRA